MKTILVSLSVLLITTLSLSQSYKLTWGDEVKLKKSTTDMDIVAADNSGVYFTEGQLKMKSYFVIGASFTTAYKLIKFDNNFNQLYEKEYKKELRGYQFHSFQMLDENLYMFATDYDKKEKMFKVFGVKIDKSSGDFIGDLSELGSYQLENKHDDYEVKLDTFNSGKNFLMVTDISNDDRNSIAVSVLDSKLQKKESAVIDMAYEKDTYTVQDVKYVSGKIAILGKEYERIVKKGKTKKKLVFKQFALAIYNDKGKKEKDIDLGTNSRFVIGGQMILQPTGELLLAGFYSDQQKKENLNGFFLNKVDLVKGELILSSYKEINASMLGTAVKDDTDEDDDDKKQKKNIKKDDDDDVDDELPNNFIIKTVDVNPTDMSYIITAEVSQYKTYTYSRSEYISGHTTRTTYTVRQFINKDILVIDADKSAQIKWVNILPKYQMEEITTQGTGFYYDFGGYFAKGGAMPYYSSYISLIKNNQLFIVMNDHEKNSANAAYKDKVKMIYNFKKHSNTYGVAIDLNNGTMKRKFISENSSDLILMPRKSYVVNNDIYMPSLRPRVLAKTELKMAKISVL